MIPIIIYSAEESNSFLYFKMISVPLDPIEISYDYDITSSKESYAIRLEGVMVVKFTLSVSDLTSSSPLRLRNLP